MRALIAVASVLILLFVSHLGSFHAFSRDETMLDGISFDVTIVREYGSGQIFRPLAIGEDMLCYNLFQYPRSTFPVEFNFELVLIDTRTMLEVDLGLEGQQFYPHTDGSLLAFMRSADLVVMDIRTGDKVILNVSTSELLLSGGHLFVVQNQMNGGDILSYDVRGGTWNRITDSPFDEEMMAVRGDRLAYVKVYSGGSVVCLNDVVGGKEAVISDPASNIMSLSMDRRHVIWAQDEGILLHDIEKVITRTIAPGMKVGGLSIDGDIAVWSGRFDRTNDRNNLFLHHIPSGRTVELFMNASSQLHPSISGNRIFYIEKDGNSERVMMIEITSMPSYGSRTWDLPSNASSAYPLFLAADLTLVLLMASAVFLREGPRTAPPGGSRGPSRTGRGAGPLRGRPPSGP